MCVLIQRLQRSIRGSFHCQQSRLLVQILLFCYRLIAKTSLTQTLQHQFDLRVLQLHFKLSLCRCQLCGFQQELQRLQILVQGSQGATCFGIAFGKGFELVAFLRQKAQSNTVKFWGKGQERPSLMLLERSQPD